jgi:hypothetical protein
MFRWLGDSQEQAGSEIRICRGELEVMESRLLMSVNAISRLVGIDRDAEDDVGAEGADAGAPALDDGGAWWI